MTTKEAIAVICLITLLSGAVVGIFSIKGCLGGADDPLHIANRRLQSTTDQLTKAHELWDAFERPEAITRYKAILRSEDRGLIESELPIVYRRVIEWEAEYGDPDSAKDWCHRAKQEWPYRTRPVSFSSDVAQRLWNEVTTNSNYSIP